MNAVTQRTSLPPLPDLKVVQRALGKAIARFTSKHRHLLQDTAGIGHETNIFHHLARCVEDEFPAWHVDINYNRDCGDIKRAPNRDGDVAPVLPDLIVHQRGSKDRNLLIVEGKNHTWKDDRLYEDGEKMLREMRALSYKFSCYLLFCRDRVEVAWFRRRLKTDKIELMRAEGRLRSIMEDVAFEPAIFR